MRPDPVGRQTQENLHMIYDVLIIGAGCTGVMTARLLSTKTAP